MTHGRRSNLVVLLVVTTAQVISAYSVTVLV